MFPVESNMRIGLEHHISSISKALITVGFHEVQFMEGLTNKCVVSYHFMLM